MSFGDGELERIANDAQNAIGRVQERAQAELDKQPPLAMISAFYWRAFQKLGTDRPMTMAGAGLIPLSSIREYAQFLEMSYSEYETFERVIRTVDAHQLSLRAKAQKRQKSS